MTTIDTRPDDAAVGAVAEPSAAESFFSGVAAYATATDHKRIGRLYVGFGLLVLLAVSVVALVLGLERADESSTMLDADAVLQMFQVYRVGLVFGALVPIALGLAIAVTPLQLGARSIAFPRVALTGFYAWLGGLALTISALGRNGGMGGGDNNAIDLYLAGHGLLILGLLAGAGSVATSVLTTRAPGMTMRRVPLFAWSTLIGALGMLLALPVVFGAIIYLFIDHRLGIEANFGGAEGIGPWLGWAYSVPAVIVYALPAIGVAAEMIPVTFKHRQVMRGVKFAGIALVGVTALAATTQQFAHDVDLTSDFDPLVRSALPFLIFAGLPVLGLTVALGLGLLTAKQGLSNAKPSISAPFVLSLFGLSMIGLGVDANFLLGITDLELAGTSFEEGATLLVTYGTALGVMGGLTFWAPKLWGRTLSDKQVMPLGLLGLAGAALAGLPLILAGFFDQAGGVPASDADVAAIMAIGDVNGGQLWQILSLAGHGLMALTILAFAGLLLKTVTGDGEVAEQNPYGGHTIEWSTTSPAPADNYEYVATVASSEPQFDMTHEGSLS
jgi:heme/copper-type cytochrome/quinol oxidase subunit 1